MGSKPSQTKETKHLLSTALICLGKQKAFYFRHEKELPASNSARGRN